MRIGVGLIGGLLALMLIVPFIWIVIVYAFFSDSTIRSDTPLTFAVATKDGGVYPPGASNIYYLTHVEGLQIGIFYERMDVPPGQLQSAVDFLIGEHNKTYGNNVFARSPDPRLDMDTRFEPAPWWDTMWIMNGYRMSSPTASLVILVDEEHSRIYAHWTH